MSNRHLNLGGLKTWVADKMSARAHNHIVLADGTMSDFQGRLITLHNQQKNAHHGFPSNYVSTTHYTWYNFLPKSLLNQFRRVANAYFLVCAVLSLLPLSPYEPYTSISPLFFVLGVSIIREALEDYSRYKEDRFTNSRKARILRDESFVEVSWADIVVGDIVRVDIDTMIPADLVLLASSDESGLCYVETANLDGETNLKAKASLSNTQQCLSEKELLRLRAEILAEHPSTDLYKFQGQFLQNRNVSAIVPNNIVLRGCELRNTNFIHGVAIYTGNETRIQMNASRPSNKQSRIERAMNREIYRILFLQFLLCVVAAIVFGILKNDQQDGQWYRAHRSDVAAEAAETAVTWLLLLSVMLPISLYVTMEIVKMIQGYHISWDLGMYYAPVDKPCEVRSVSLNEDLGQITHVFSDKTGTLTRNEMVFVKGSVAGKVYEHLDTQGRVVAQLFDGMRTATDPNEQETLHMFLLNLALCHTVIPEPIVDPVTNETTYKYLSPSPDEEALVVAAACNHYVLTQRTASTLTIRIPSRSSSSSSSLQSQSQTLTYSILRVLEFTSDRKRMSIILRCPDNRLLMLTKGADAEVLKRLDPSTPSATIQSTKHNLVLFASDGLRTLMLGHRWLTEQWFEEWNTRYEAASVSLDRDTQVEEVSDTAEHEFTLSGATAIEDRLQDGVPDTLTKLRTAGVRVWVLTGDKQETAINIGHSSGLLVSGMHIFVLNGLSDEEVKANDDAARKQLGFAESDAEQKNRRARQAKDHTINCFENALKHIQQTSGVNQGLQRRGSHGLGYALVLDSETLKWALDDKLTPDLRPTLLELSELCRSVLLCRCTPLQKAQAVELVKTRGKNSSGLAPVTLAIGDGANDVGMIQAAHIGVGISGKEGMQAVQASDYAFAQFAYLQRLMFLHGRWNYRRISLLVVYSFYKNIALVITQIWFGCQSQFTGQTLYDGLAGNIYNVFFTSGVLVTAVVDKDASERVLLAHPELYRSGMFNERFTSRIFWSWWFEGLWCSGLIYFVCMYMLCETIGDKDGRDLGLLSNGYVVYTTAVLVVNFRLALANNHWTWINWFFLWGSLALWYLFGIFYASDAGLLMTYSVYWAFLHLMSIPRFWLAPLLLVVSCNLPTFVKMSTQRELKKSLKQKLKETERRGDELPGEKAARESTSLQDRANQRTLTAKDRQVSIIIDVGHRNKQSSYSGFAMDAFTNPFSKAKRAATKTARALSKRISLKVNKPNNPSHNDGMTDTATSDNAKAGDSFL